MLGLAAGVTVLAVRVPPVRQDPAYHGFADQRSWLGIPNFLNVVSNLPFVVIGIAGLAFTCPRDRPGRRSFVDASERWPYFWLFVGVFLTGFGSAYYHWTPTNGRLVWDRLPMTIAFASFVAALISERISRPWGLRLLPLLILLGSASVLSWYRGELEGHGDLRFYAAVQAYSALALVAAVVLPSEYSRRGDFAVVFAWYAAAKILEMADHRVFALGQMVGGHTLKHLASAAAAYWLLRMLQQRQPRSLACG